MSHDHLAKATGKGTNPWTLKYVASVYVELPSSAARKVGKVHAMMATTAGKATTAGGYGTCFRCHSTSGAQPTPRRQQDLFASS